MRAVGIRTLKNRLSECVRLVAAGETVLVTDRERVVAELVPPVLARALAPFPVPVRTLDALPLASIEFFRGLGQRPGLATHDQRLAAAAEALAIPLVAA